MEPVDKGPRASVSCDQRTWSRLQYRVQVCTQQTIKTINKKQIHLIETW